MKSGDASSGVYGGCIRTCQAICTKFCRVSTERWGCFDVTSDWPINSFVIAHHTLVFIRHKDWKTGNVNLWLKNKLINMNSVSDSATSPRKCGALWMHLKIITFRLDLRSENLQSLFSFCRDNCYTHFFAFKLWKTLNNRCAIHFLYDTVSCVIMRNFDASTSTVFKLLIKISWNLEVQVQMSMVGLVGHTTQTVPNSAGSVQRREH